MVKQGGPVASIEDRAAFQWRFHNQRPAVLRRIMDLYDEGCSYSSMRHRMVSENLVPDISLFQTQQEAVVRRTMALYVKQYSFDQIGERLADRRTTAKEGQRLESVNARKHRCVVRHRLFRTFNTPSLVVAKQSGKQKGPDLRCQFAFEQVDKSTNAMSV